MVIRNERLQKAGCKSKENLGNVTHLIQIIGKNICCQGVVAGKWAIDDYL
jgi:hypothetical protein